MPGALPLSWVKEYGSSGIKELSFAQDGGRKRSPRMEPAVEGIAGPDEHVGCSTRAPERLVCEATTASLGRGRVRHDNACAKHSIKRSDSK